MEIALYTVTFDGADAAELDDFWCELPRGPLDEGAAAQFASIGLSAEQILGPQWTFVQVPEDQQVKNRLYVDPMANRADDNYPRSTLADPEGNEFDIVAV